MNRPIALAAVLVAVAVLGYLAILAITGPGAGGRDLQATTTAPGNAISEEIVEDNASTLGASAAATDEAFESAQEGEEPVQPNLATSRDLASDAGAVGAAAFTPEGYDRTTVVNAIEESNLEEAEKDDLMDRLAAAEPVEGDLELALEEIRERLALAE